MSDNLYSNSTDLHDLPAGNVIGRLDNGVVLYVNDVLAAQDGSIWYARAGKEASAEYGDAALEAAAKDIEITLFGK